jgi:hypothetical protein
MVAGVLDLRPLIVLLTLVRQHLKALDGRPAENVFTIGLRDVCEAMAIEPSSSNIRAVFAQLKRWWQTSFMIVDDIYGMFDWAPNAFEVGQGFSVISGLNYVSWVGREGATPEIIQVRLFQPGHSQFTRKYFRTENPIRCATSCTTGAAVWFNTSMSPASTYSTMSERRSSRPSPSMRFAESSVKRWRKNSLLPSKPTAPGCLDTSCGISLIRSVPSTISFEPPRTREIRS